MSAPNRRNYIADSLSTFAAKSVKSCGLTKHLRLIGAGRTIGIAHHRHQLGQREQFVFDR